ncbi:MAG: hypothetical protein KatS3mg071_1829 [Meiothermus sp.]|nr:MAG: hypothetical protein KatS3mg071_1829 [Meiothermus sp.]
MPRRKSNPQSTPTTAANVGYEAELWKMADTLRGSMDAAEYKHVVLGLIFLKYISDAFEELHRKLEAERAQGADPEDPDEYRAQNIFWVPPVGSNNFGWSGCALREKLDHQRSYYSKGYKTAGVRPDLCLTTTILPT